MSAGNPYPLFFDDLTDAQNVINDGHNPSDSPAPAAVDPYPQSHAGPSSGTGSAVGPTRSADVPSSRSQSAPYTRRLRSTVSQGGQFQPPTSDVPLYRRSSAEEWKTNILLESELAGSVGQMATTVSGSAGPSSSLAAPALIVKREAVEPWMSANAPAPGYWTGSEMQTPVQHPYAGAIGPAWQSSPSLMMAPVVPSNAAFPSTTHGAAQPRTRPSRSRTKASSSVKQAYSRLAAGSEHYGRCSMQECSMQHWDGIVSRQVWQVVAPREEPTSPIKDFTTSLKYDLLALFPNEAAAIHGTLRWGPFREIHLHSLYSASAVDANGRDLTSIPGFAKIPGSLKLLVMLGGERLYDELKNHVMVTGALSVAIGNALQPCGLVICDAFWKQLEMEKEAIEKGFLCRFVLGQSGSADKCKILA
ncbi:hypothetical protein BJ912DRAFT_1064998 [Pholiota molesta]|nr:hypothetical protein BJ912DRAFT_1064998 [Pholiota molesta]